MGFTCEGGGTVMVTGDPYPEKSTAALRPTTPF